MVSTSALLLGVPWALAFAEEQQMVEMEKEARMRELGNEVCVFGGDAGACVWAVEDAVGDESTVRRRGGIRAVEESLG